MCRPAPLGKNFWMVVKTTPPTATDSFSRRSARLSACTGGWRSRSRQREKVVKSWSSRSLRSVKYYDCRVLHGRFADDGPGVEGHGQALARPLGVPDHSDTVVAAERRPAWRPDSYLPRMSPLTRFRRSTCCKFRCPQGLVDGGEHGVELVIAGHLLDQTCRCRRHRTR